jgi:splicing factor U2AF subunit
MAYEKTGACPKGDLCQQSHRNIEMPRCLVFHHIYPDPELFIDMLPPDVFSLSAKQKQNLIDAFYLDMFLMLRNFGLLEDILLCGNKSDHLSGNLIVMYKEVQSATSTLMALNGQYYAGRKIAVTFAPILRLSNAICRSAGDAQCQLGAQCNFVHPLNPSKFVMNECFPRGPRHYAPPFRTARAHRIVDTPGELLYGESKMRREDE